MKLNKKTLLTVLPALALALLPVGCASTAETVTQSAGGKNLNLDGYVMYGAIETANSETGTPQGKMIMGRVTYKSRKVGIPADQKVPTTGYFKSTKSKSLFGTEEEIVEYDFTAGSEADAEKALKALEAKRAEVSKKSEVSEKSDETAKTASDT